MAKRTERDIIDKVFDRIVKGPEFQGLSASISVTHYGVPAIARRLGCSLSTVHRMMKQGRLMFYYRVRGGKSGRLEPCVNETMLALTFAAWWHASRAIEREKHTKAPPAPREAMAKLPG